MLTSDILIISPHMDDAVISLGGFIKVCGKPVFIVDVFGYDPWTRPPFSKVNKKSNIEVRKKEEGENQKLYNYQVEFWNYKAAWKERGYLDWQGEVDWDRDGKLISNLKDRVLRVISEKQFKIVIFPLAVGGHIDHLICNHIALSISGYFCREVRFLFYEDLPYAFNPALWCKSPLWFKITRGKMRAKRINIESVVELKKRAISNYRSQFTERELSRMIDFSYKRSKDSKIHKFKERYLEQFYSVEERLWSK